MKVLLTGGAGFVGHHLVQQLLETTDYEIIILDRLDTSGNLNRIEDVLQQGLPEWRKRVSFIWHDLKAPLNELIIHKIGHVDIVYHLAAGSHVDRSIDYPMEFVMDNVVGTCNLLDYVRLYCKNLQLFQYFSCYDEETVAVTTEGLKTYIELKVGDEVLTINPNTKAIEVQPVEKVIIQDYIGEIIDFKKQGIDISVTPNHRMYNDKLEVYEAKECKLEENFNFPVFNKYHGVDTEIYIDNKSQNLIDLFYIIGIYIGDGILAYQEKKYPNKSSLTKKQRDKSISTRDPKTGRFISTSKIGTYDEVISKCHRIWIDIPETDLCRSIVEQTLTRLGINFTKQKNQSGEHIYFSSENWYHFFEQFGNSAHNKKIPKWILQYDWKYLQALWHGLTNSDGNNETYLYKSYTTVSTELKDNITELCVKIGLYPTVYTTFNTAIYRGREIKGPCYSIHTSFGNKKITNKYINSREYNGKIWCIQVKNKNFLTMRNGYYMFSGNTDEVFGPAPQNIKYKEWDRYKSSNPYSASKAGAEELCIAYENTYKLPIIITHCMNIVGLRQMPEKFVPLVIKKVLLGEKVYIHANPDCTKAGFRHYIHAIDVADATLFLTQQCLNKQLVYGDKFNIVGEKELDNLTLAQTIADIVGKPLKYELVDFHSSRPGHDLRYALDGDKMEKMGWVPKKKIEERLVEIVEWSLNNKFWLGL